MISVTSRKESHATKKKLIFCFPFPFFLVLYMRNDHLTMVILTILTMNFQINMKKILKIEKKNLYVFLLDVDSNFIIV
jgi:hypothetical protein